MRIMMASAQEQQEPQLSLSEKANDNGILPILIRIPMEKLQMAGPKLFPKRVKSCTTRSQ